MVVRTQETKTVEFTEHDSGPILHALKKQLGVAKTDLNHMKMSLERELTHFERNQMSEALRGMSREELEEQINPWISLVMLYEHWIAKFTFDK